MSKYPPETHAWYAENLGASEIGRIIGRSRYVANRMKESGRFETWAMKHLLAAHPIPAAPTAGDSTQPTAQTETPATPDAPAQTSATAVPDAQVGAAVATAKQVHAPASMPMPFSNIADALPERAKCLILMPGRSVGLQTLYCVQALVEIGKGKIAFAEPSSMYDVFMNRNRLVHRFLQGDATWAFFLDPDNIVPCERPEWYRRNVPAARKWENPAFASMNAINRLATHHLTDKTKKIVGACYFDRMGFGLPMFADGRENPDIRGSLNSMGPRDAVVSAGRYAATGALLVHRQVFLDIMEKVPMTTQDSADLAAAPWEGYTYDFFGKLRYQGDDVSFCERARMAGHQPFVDLAVCAGHVGTYGYSHETINSASQ